MDYRERRGEAISALAKAGNGMRPSDFFRRNVVLSSQEDAIGSACATWIKPRGRRAGGRAPL